MRPVLFQTAAREDRRDPPVVQGGKESGYVVTLGRPLIGSRFWSRAAFCVDMTESTHGEVSPQPAKGSWQCTSHCGKDRCLPQSTVDLVMCIG